MSGWGIVRALSRGCEMSGPWWFLGGLVVGLLAALAPRWAFERRRRAAPVVAPATPAAADGPAHEREELLRSVLDAAPTAIVLFSDVGRIAVANQAARELFFEGRDPQGENFLAMMGGAPDALRRALSSDGDELFSVHDGDGEPQTYNLIKRRLVIAGERVVLVLVKNLSRELHRQEAEAWRRIIRIFCHELNNSLAPISSLVHTGRQIVEGNAGGAKLERVFATIAERTAHLTTFLEGYAEFARLPVPRKEETPWRPLVERLLALWPGLSLEGEVPTEPGWMDPSQIEQVAINLLKNADEAGGPREAITLSITSLGPRGVRLTVADRGTGMSAKVMESAFVAFYSTKQRGSGLGLPLCREIVEAHGGAIRLESRDGGGLAVHVRLPGRSAEPDGAIGKLTLTRN